MSAEEAVAKENNDFVRENPYEDCFVCLFNDTLAGPREAPS